MTDWKLRCSLDHMVITRENYKHFGDFLLCYPMAEDTKNEVERIRVLLANEPIKVVDSNGDLYGELTCDSFEQLLSDLKIQL